MELKFVNDETRTHNTFTKRLVNVGQFVTVTEVADFFVDLDPIVVNDHIEIQSGQYIHVWLPDMEGPDQIEVASNIYLSDAIELLDELPPETVLIMGSKYPKLQEVRIYHKVEKSWYKQLYVQLDMSDGDSITIY